MGDLFIPLIQTTAMTSAGVFAGYTWALSHAAIPTVLHANDPILSEQWRTQYLAGFYISRPLCVLNGLTFSYLAYTAPVASPERTLYFLAALLSSSGVPYALTLLRRTNGALSLRAHKVAGKHRDDPIALTYARGDAGAMEREREWTTREMAERWKWHNNFRTGILLLGTLLGGLGVGLSKRREV
jgi:hypothetical protein